MKKRLCHEEGRFVDHSGRAWWQQCVIEHFPDAAASFGNKYEFIIIKLKRGRYGVHQLGIKKSRQHEALMTLLRQTIDFRRARCPCGGASPPPANSALIDHLD